MSSDYKDILYDVTNGVVRITATWLTVNAYAHF